MSWHGVPNELGVKVAFIRSLVELLIRQHMKPKCPLVGCSFAALLSSWSDVSYVNVHLQLSR